MGVKNSIKRSHNNLNKSTERSQLIETNSCTRKEEQEASSTKKKDVSIGRDLIVYTYTQTDTNGNKTVLKTDSEAELDIYFDARDFRDSDEICTGGTGKRTENDIDGEIFFKFEYDITKWSCFQETK